MTAEEALAALEAQPPDLGVGPVADAVNAYRDAKAAHDDAYARMMAARAQVVALLRRAGLEGLTL